MRNSMGPIEMPAASVQDAMLPVTRRSADSIAYVRDADPLDLMGNTPFTPPVIKPPLVARGFSEQMEVFRALGRLAGTKNAPLRPYQQTLIEEYTNSFNKLLTLRALDLSGNKVGLEANPHNFLLMHAMGPNVVGVLGSAVAAGVLLALAGG